MLRRRLFDEILNRLRVTPAVAILGCRQVGKTTLAHQLQHALGKTSLYLDLELPEDRAKFADPQIMLEQHADKLLILDEIQRVPELFSVMRGIIDRRRRAGEQSGHYLILGSASKELLKQSSESLAGRIAYMELDPFSLEEVNQAEFSDVYHRLWIRGGFPNSFLAENDDASMLWRKDFIRTYLERDLPQMGKQFPADRLYRLWMMLAYDQGTILNASRLANSLEISVGSVRNYMEVMADLFLIRFLRPWSGNSRKRLIKSPKVYVRDSGIVHALTNLKTLDEITGHSICGFSWEGFVMEQILQQIPFNVIPSYYRSSTGDEIDLVLELPSRKTLAIEIKRSSTPKLSKGFIHACQEIKPTQRYFIVPTGDGYQLDTKTEVISLQTFLEWMNSQSMLD
jgi:predicted AAA+ superfamily ATPase